MKIAGWEVPHEIINAAERRMRKGPFDVAHIRGVASDSNLLPPARVLNGLYIRDEIGTRLIAQFKRAGKILSVPGSRSWVWVGAARTGESDCE